MSVLFRRLKKDDFSNILRWIREPEVLDVWDSAQNQTNEDIIHKYEERLSDKEIDTYVIICDNTDIGIIQTYYVQNLSDFGLSNTKAAGIDLYIGEPNFRNKGIGTQVITTFIQGVILVEKDIEYICIDPEVSNERAIRAYEKVGFKRYNVKYDSYSDLLTLYMKMKV